MTTIRTRNIIPIDLNSILCMVEFSLANLFRDVLHDTATTDHYTSLAINRRQAIDELLWDEEFGLWLDYDCETKTLIKQYYASSIFPLWTYTINSTNWNKTQANRAYNTLKRLGVLNWVGGLPTSLVSSGQQWDFPNAWPPLQHVVVQGLTQVNLDETNDDAKRAASKLAKTFLETAYISWKTTGHMYEKYDVTKRSTPGGGGEYEVQEGFGWTNGVVLSLLQKYGSTLDAPVIHENSVSSMFDRSSIVVMMVVLMSALFLLL